MSWQRRVEWNDSSGSPWLEIKEVLGNQLKNKEIHRGERKKSALVNSRKSCKLALSQDWRCCFERMPSPPPILLLSLFNSSDVTLLLCFSPSISSFFWLLNDDPSLCYPLPFFSFSRPSLHRIWKRQSQKLLQSYRKRNKQRGNGTMSFWRTWGDSFPTFLFLYQYSNLYHSWSSLFPSLSGSFALVFPERELRRNLFEPE